MVAPNQNAAVANPLQNEKFVVSNCPGALFLAEPDSVITGWDDLTKALSTITALRNTGDFDEALERSVDFETFQVSGAHNPRIRNKRVDRGHTLTGSFLEHSIQNVLAILDMQIVELGTATDGFRQYRAVPRRGSDITQWTAIFEYIGVSGSLTRELVHLGSFTGAVALSTNRTGKQVLPFTFIADQVAGLDLFEQAGWTDASDAELAAFRAIAAPTP